jgi:hypothetical protein
MINKVRELAERHHVRGVGRSGGCLPRGDAMSRYSLAKVDNEYVVQVEGQSVLRLSSQPSPGRQADLGTQRARGEPGNRR